MTENFTTSDLVHLSTLFPWVLSHARITWTPDNGDTLYHGSVRRLCTENYGPARENDVRALFLHITTEQGTETLIPVRDAMTWARTGAICEGWR